ncbi:MAG: hypothetical protein KBE65_06295 [Phycisphaerae bacterium]|nr:hypothetical protein [Phycisphaerae bacterium]
MRVRIQTGIVQVFVLATVMATTAWAQGEQWLQYRSAREARQIVGDVGYVYRQLVTAKPEGVKLPEFKASQVWFLDWKTPMTASGTVWLVFDKSSPSGQYDRLYIDGNANGDLSDDSVLEPYQQDGSRCLFGPVKVVFDTADGPITYHLSIDFRAYNSQQTYCLLYSAGWYEGPVTLDGVKKHCTLIDYNVNGVFNDKSVDAEQCDRIRIGEAGGRDTRYVGNFIEVGDKLYRPEIAKDGAFVILTEAKDVAFSTVRVAENITSLGAGGVNGLFLCKPDKGVVKLPIGDYRIEHWSITRNDDKGGRWELRADSSASSTAFTVATDGQKELPFGEPIYSVAEYTQSGSFYNFRQSLEGRHGERITLTRNGSQPAAPKLRIRSRDGAYDRALSFEYG